MENYSTKPVACQNHFGHTLYTKLVNAMQKRLELSKIMLEKLEPELKIINAQLKERDALQAAGFHSAKNGWDEKMEALNAEIKEHQHILNANTFNSLSNDKCNHLFVSFDVLDELCDELGIGYCYSHFYTGSIPPAQLEVLKDPRIRFAESARCCVMRRKGLFDRVRDTNYYPDSYRTNFNEDRSDKGSWCVPEPKIIICSRAEIDYDTEEYKTSDKDFFNWKSENTNVDPIVLIPFLHRDKRYALVVTAWQN